MAHHDGFLGHAKSQSQVVAQVENPWLWLQTVQFVALEPGEGAGTGRSTRCEM